MYNVFDESTTFILMAPVTFWKCMTIRNTANSRENDTEKRQDSLIIDRNSVPCIEGSGIKAGGRYISHPTTIPREIWL